MHMADALLSPAAGIAMCAVSAGAIAYSTAKVKKDDLCDKKIPVMAVTGAFVFAAQMINFTIPATGSSGHIGGGILLASMIGGYPGLLSLTAVLIIQCLFFADGGLLALGCNVFNMGVIPCLIIYPLIFRAILKKGITYKRLSIASFVSVVAGLELGAFFVVLETLVSGISELPFGTFVTLMLPIHLVIGAVEGIVTAAIACFVYKVRPEILESSLNRTVISSGISMKKVLVIIAASVILAGGVLSIFASSNPDGLEWAIQGITGSTEIEAQYNMDGVAEIQNATAFMPDYDYASTGEEGSSSGTAVAGIVGGAMTFALAGAAGLIISKAKKKKAAVA